MYTEYQKVIVVHLSNENNTKSKEYRDGLYLFDTTKTVDNNNILLTTTMQNTGSFQIQQQIRNRYTINNKLKEWTNQEKF